MQYTNIPLSLEKKSDGYYKRIDAKVEKELLGDYVREFCEAFANDEYLYRIGKMSKEVIFQSATYGDVSRFAQKLNASKKLESHIFETNPGLAKEYKNEFTYHTWIDLYSFITEEYEDAIKQKILEVKRLVPSKEKKTLETKTYEYDGEEVVFLSFYQACYGESEIYAVPVDVALELCLEDYDGEEVSRWSDLWDKLSSYEVKEELVIKASCIKTYNYD